MKTLFVSYEHSEALWCRQIINALERPLKLSVNIWVDYALEPGVEFELELKRQVQLSDAFLIIVSEKYIASDFITTKEWLWIREELDKGKKLFWIPLDIDNEQANRSNEILIYLSEREIAYGKWQTLNELLAQEPINNSDLSNALLYLTEKVRNWANHTDNPKQTTKKPAEFNEKQLEEHRKSYLSAIIKSCNNIDISSLNEENSTNRPILRLPLDRIYVTLQADPTTIQERLETRALYHELAYSEPDISNVHDPIQDKLAKIIQERETHLPDRSQVANLTSEHELEAVFRRELVLVILGDPGSGKSVLCRWIALQMANSLLETNSPDQTELGPPRLPILLRVARFAEFLKSKYFNDSSVQIIDQTDTQNDFYQFLGQHPEENFLTLFKGEQATASLTTKARSEVELAIGAVCRNAIETKQAVILIDGLDEVIDARLRGMVCDTVEHFITEKIIPPEESNNLGQMSSFANPEDTGNNQVVLTSRITGYHLAPLRLGSAQHFLIRPLDDDKVSALCRKVGKVVDKTDQVTGTGEKLLEAIQDRTDHALERLKRNPLLLTALFSYFVSHDYTLPATRVELYRKLTLDLARRWELTEQNSKNNSHIASRLTQKIRGFLKDKSPEERDIFLLKLLATVAMEIHESSSTGRIDRRRLEKVFDEQLKYLIGIDLLRDEDADFTDDYGKQLADLVAERLGILVELASDIFGFLHLTFQEYLVGWKFLYTHSDQQTVSENFIQIFVERLQDIRWREPLLFAFGEFTQNNINNTDTASFLASLRNTLSNENLPDENILFMADLLDEMDSKQAATEEWREVLLALLQGYANCAISPAKVNRRERFAEKITKLRRRQPTLVRQQCLALFYDDDRLTCPIAHLFWQRQWLPIEVLTAFSNRQQLDSAAWHWPMYMALSQSLKANQYLDAAPLEKLTPPNEDDAFGIRLYEVGFHTWQQQQQMFYTERDWVKDCLPETSFSLRTFFCENKEAWTSISTNPSCLRVLVCLLGAVDNIEAAKWTLEYRWIAEFLYGEDLQRKQRMLADPGKFVPRWGVNDTVYNMAVYLDTNPDARFGRSSSVPKVAAEFIVTRLPESVEKVFQRIVYQAYPDKTLRTELQRLVHPSDTEACALACIGLMLMGDKLSGKPNQKILDLCRRSTNYLRDAVFRATTSQSKSWFDSVLKKDELLEINPKLVLDDAQLSIIYSCVTEAAITALDSPNWISNDGQNHMAVVSRASQWAYRFTKQSDDPDDYIDKFAVLLNTMGPEATGWNSALPLLSRILHNPNLNYIQALESTNYPSFWGIIPEEKLIPPAFFLAVERLALLAEDLSLDFSWEFGEVFLKHLPNSGILGLQKKITQFSLGFDLTGLDIDPRKLQRIEAPMLSQTSQLGVRLQGFDLKNDADWESLLNAPKIENTINKLELSLTEGNIEVNDHNSSFILTLVERLSKVSPLDACLFLARSAQYAPTDTARNLLEEALRQLKHVDDAYAQAEFLARFRQIPRDLTEKLASLHNHLCEQLKQNHPILAAHASGRVGNYLCNPEFPWNATDGLGTDPSWVVVASYAAMNELLVDNDFRQDLSGLWKDLLLSPGLSKVDDILTRARANGLECTLVAISTLEQLTNQPNLYVSRLVFLLSRPTSAALQLLKKWLVNTNTNPYAAIFQAQAALLLAERNRILAPELIAPLIVLRELGDDMSAARAEIALASSLRDVDRKQRRFSLKKHGSEIVKLLAKQILTTQALPEKAHLYKCAGLGLNDWQFDDAEILQQWCEEALANSEAESLLLQVIKWVDIWSTDCQVCICTWLLATSGEAGKLRHETFINWAGRLECLKNVDLAVSVLNALNQIPLDDPIRQLGCFAQTNNEHKGYVNILVVLEILTEYIYMDAKSLCSVAEQELAGTLEQLFSGGGKGELNKAILADLGRLNYSKIGEYPEDCLEMLLPYLNDHAFMFALMSWLHYSIKNLSDDLYNSTRVEAKIEVLKMEALLSFAVCFSERNPNGFIRDTETRDGFLVDLAKLCYLLPNQRSLMATVTLITRLKSVVLDQEFELAGNTYSVLDALLYGLHRDSNVQQRITDVLPNIKGLQGGKIITYIGELIYSLGVANQRGTVVLAAAQLLQQLLHSNTLNSNERREAGRLLRNAASAPQNRRPLYRQIGYGGNNDPVTVVYVGDLAEELETLVTKIW